MPFYGFNSISEVGCYMVFKNNLGAKTEKCSCQNFNKSFDR